MNIEENLRLAILSHSRNSGDYLPDYEYENVIKEFISICKEVEDENLLLREMLWSKHGCEISALYGDDGELQCGKCMIDFKRDTAKEIENKWHQLVLLRLKTDEELKSELKKLFSKSEGE